MKRIKICLHVLFLLIVASLTGCFDMNEEDSQLPWAQPASWEGRLPGGVIPNGVN